MILIIFIDDTNIISKYYLCYTKDEYNIYSRYKYLCEFTSIVKQQWKQLVANQLAKLQCNQDYKISTQARMI